MENTENIEVSFEPLARVIGRLGLSEADKERVMGEYMFMFMENALNAYKHSWTRDYVYIGESGDVQQGSINIGTYS